MTKAPYDSDWSADDQAAADAALQKSIDDRIKAKEAELSKAIVKENTAHDTEWAAPISPSEVQGFIGTPMYNKAVLDAANKLAVQESARELVKAARNPVGPLTIISESEVLDRPAPEWWITDLVQKGTVAVFAGEAGIGKTFTLLDWTHCIATGVPWQGEAVRQGSVLYVAAEGASAFGKRIRAWTDYHHSTPAAGSYNYIESGVNLSDPDSVSRLEAALDTLQPDIIVLDTLSQLAAIDNENDAAQLAKVFRVAKQLRDHKQDSTVILVHHVNKGAGAVRGSSVIRSNADTVIVAKGSGDGFSLSTELIADGKQKDGQPIRMEGFKLTDHNGSAIVTRSGVIADPDWAATRALFADGAAHSKVEVRIACGFPKADNSDSSYKKWDRKFTKWTKDSVLIDNGDKTYSLPSVAASGAI